MSVGPLGVTAALNWQGTGFRNVQPPSLHLPSEAPLLPLLMNPARGRRQAEWRGQEAGSAGFGAKQRRDTDPGKHFFPDWKDKPRLHPTLLKCFDDFVFLQVIDDIVANQDEEEKTKKKKKEKKTKKEKKEKETKETKEKNKVFGVLEIGSFLFSLFALTPWNNLKSDETTVTHFLGNHANPHLFFVFFF